MLHKLYRMKNEHRQINRNKKKKKTCDENENQWETVKQPKSKDSRNQWNESFIQFLRISAGRKSLWATCDLKILVENPSSMLPASAGRKPKPTKWLLAVVIFGFVGDWSGATALENGCGLWIAAAMPLSQRNPKSEEMASWFKRRRI